MKGKEVIYTLLSIMISAILYTIILWYPFGGWLINNVIIHVNFGFSSPNILEGFILMFLSLILLVLLFVLPFILIWTIIIFVFIFKKFSS